MDMETYDIIRNLSMYSVFLPLLFFIRAMRRKQQPAAVKLLGTLLIASALSDFTCFIGYRYFKINPNPIILVYVVLQFILLSFIYRSVYQKVIFRTIATGGTILFIIFAVTNAFFVQGMVKLNSNAFTMSSAVLLLYSLAYFYQLLQELPNPFIELIFMFWISSAVFIYFGTNLFLFATVDRIVEKDTSQFMLSWALHNGSNAFKNIIFTIAMIIAAKKNSA